MNTLQDSRDDTPPFARLVRRGSIACALLIACTVWIATAAQRTKSAAEAASSPAPAPAAAR